MPLSSPLQPDHRDALQSDDVGEVVGLRRVLQPILAGARARGVADGLEMLGLGAVLIDASGTVLQVGHRSQRMLDGWARVVEHHLLAERASDNRSVQDLIGSVIGAERHDPQLRIHIAASGGSPAMSIRALRFDTDEGPAQRLHAVLVLEAT